MMLLATYKRGRGFMLIELIASFSIIAVLLAVSLGLYTAFRPEHSVSADARKVESVLRLARNKTRASENASSFGVHMEQMQIVLFEGTAYDAADPDNDVVELDTRNELYEFALGGGGADVIFNRPDGVTNNNGTVSMRSRSDPLEIAVVYVDALGGVSTQEGGAVGDTNLARDARHVHFDLGFSIQDAVTLEFDFPDASVTESVPMASYFNADSTVFDWAGSFVVGGDAQEFRVQTHMLDAFDTNLSVTRDRSYGKNTQRVQIRIIDGGVTKGIATYLADEDDTVQVGAFGGAMEIQ